jgi:hypothetical protein
LDGGSAKVFTACVATALAAGIGMGSYLQLPEPEPALAGSQPVLSEDPGLTKWREVIANLGGLGATFVVPIAFRTQPAPVEAQVYDTSFERDLDQLAAEIDAQMRDAELRHARWARDAQWYREQAMIAAQAQLDRQAWEARAYGYAPPQPPEPPPARRYASAYPAEPAYAYRPAPPDEFPDEPVPPPPPRPSMNW